MFRISPVKIGNVKKNIISRTIKQKKVSKVDLTGEENGYFKFGKDMVRVIFPR